MVNGVRKAVTRCRWCGDDPLYVAYHDEEWGVPVHDDRLLFEMLVLEGAQAGLSWLIFAQARGLSQRIRPLRRQEDCRLPGAKVESAHE